MELSLNDSGLNGDEVIWDIVISNNDRHYVIRERVVDAKNNAVLLSNNWDGEKDKPLDFSQFKMNSSTLKLIGEKTDNHILSSLHKYLQAIAPLKWPSPADRIADMTDEERTELCIRVSEFVGYDVMLDALITIIIRKGQPIREQAIIEMKEKWDDNRTLIKQELISDGLLRIISLLAFLVKNTENALFMLDELEDGINPGLAEKLVKSFKDITLSSKRQVIVTSHSPIMVNYADKDDIRYMWRDKNGKIHLHPLFASKKLD